MPETRCKTLWSSQRRNEELVPQPPSQIVEPKQGLSMTDVDVLVLVLVDVVVLLLVMVVVVGGRIVVLAHSTGNCG